MSTELFLGFTLFLYLPVLHGANAQKIVIHCSTQTSGTSQDLLKDSSGNPLTAGVPRNGDGALVTLGYYNQANSSNISNHFSGDWVPLTEGTRIGDSSSGYGFGDGMFSFTTTFTRNSDVVDIFPTEPAFYQLLSPHVITGTLPAPGTPLCIKFYDSPELSSSTKYNAVTGPNWLWPSFSSGIPENLYLKISTGSPPANSSWNYGSHLKYASNNFETTEAIQWIPDLFNLSISHTNGGSVNDVNASYPEDTNVNIIATPGAHMEFVGWIGDGVSDPLFPNTVVFMTADRNITAIFQPKLYNLDVTFSGVGSVTGIGEYAYGETVSISATPSLGYEFSHWEGFGIDANTSTSHISITQDQQIKAVFLPEQQTFTANPLNPNHGDVFIAESPPYRNGGIYNILATPKFGYTFSHWSSTNGAEYMLESNTSESTTVSLSDDAIFIANFVEITRHLEILLGTGGDTATPGSGYYGISQILPINATASVGYQFFKWHDPGGIVTDPFMASTDVNMSRANDINTISANFDRKSYNITLTEGVGGNVIIDSPNGPWYHFNFYNVQAIPHPGYKFVSWTGDQQSISSLLADNNTSINQLSPTSDISLHAHFIPENYFVSVSAGEGGTVQGGGQYEIEDSPTLQATPLQGWEFSHWDANESQLTLLTSPQSPTTLINLDSAPASLAFEAVFKRPSFTINLQISGQGLVNSQSSHSTVVESGTTLSFAAIANSGWLFNQWFGIDNANVTNPFLEFNVSEDLDLIADFSIRSFDLTVNSAPGGDANGSGTYDYNQSVVINAIPFEGFAFEYWTGDVEFLVSPNSANTFVNMPDANISITPVFEMVPIAVTANVVGNGTISGEGLYNPNEEFTLQANGGDPTNLAPRGFKLFQWSWTDSNGNQMSSTDNPLTLSSTSDVSIEAEFFAIPPEESITEIITSPANAGYIFDDPSKKIWNLETDAIEHEITAIPREGFYFMGWSADNNLSYIPSWKHSTISINPTTATVLTANFREIYHEFSIIHDSSEGVISEYSSSYKHKNQIDVSATANSDHHFAGWEVIEEYIFPVTQQLSSVNTDQTVLYINQKESPELFLAKGFTYHFDVELDENDGFYFGTSQDSEISFEDEYLSGISNSRVSNGRLTFTVPENSPDVLFYQTKLSPLVKTKVNLLDIEELELFNFLSERNLTMFSNLDISFRANFEPIIYDIEIEAGAGGTVSDISGSYESSQSLTLIATPDPHHEFVRWEGSQDIINLTDSETSLIVKSSSKVRAVFRPILYPLSLTSSPSDVASFSTTENKLFFPYGTSVDIEVHPLNNFKFMEWNGNVADKFSKNISITISGPTSLEALVATKPIEVEISVFTRDHNGILRDDIPLGGIAHGPSVIQSNSAGQYTASPYDGFEFSGWYNSNGDLISNALTSSLSFPENSILRAEFKQKGYQLKVDINPRFLGTLSFDNQVTLEGINSFLPHNYAVTVTANPLNLNRFEKWSYHGDQTFAEDGNVITFSLTENATIDASFLPPIPPRLTIQVSPAESGIVVGSGDRSGSESHHIFATPNDGFEFVRWVGTGIVDPNSTTTTIEFNTDTTILAEFSTLSSEAPPPVEPSNEFTLEVLPSNTLHGLTNPFGKNTYSQGLIDITAQPKHGYIFSHWEGEGISNKFSNTTEIDLRKDTLIAAIFERSSAQQNYIKVNKNIITKDYLEENITPDISGGTIIGGSSFAAGYIPTFKAYSREGFEFVRWKNESEQTLSTEEVISYTSNNDFELTAVFKRKSHQLTVNTQPLGSSLIEWAGVKNFAHQKLLPHGEVVLLKALENDKYRFLNWQASGQTIQNPSESELSLTINNNIDVIAYYYPLEFISLEVNSFPQDGGWVIGGGQFAYNANHLIHAKPNPGFKFVRWEGNFIDDIYSQQTSINLDQNLTVWAIFEPDLSYTGGSEDFDPGLHILNLMSDNSEHGTVEGGGIYGTGWVEIEAYAKDAYEFSHWEGSNIANPNNAKTQILVESETNAKAFFKAKPLISESVNNSLEWYTSTWFGSYWNEHPNKWAYHQIFGWVFVYETSPDSYWVWINNLGDWYWIEKDNFPYLFESKSSNWIYFSEENSTPYQIMLFEFSSNRWLRR